MAKAETYTVTIDKFVHGGQALGVLPDGRKVFVWGALPGETVAVQLGRTKKSYAEGVAVAVLQAAPERIEPVDATFMATSPWQIMTLDAEDAWKCAIVAETFTRESVHLPSSLAITTLEPFGYRNKMEYSFWGDEAHGLCMALFNRGSHQKLMVDGAAISMPAVDAAARAIRDYMRSLGLRAGDFKSMMVRANQAGDAVAAIFTKQEEAFELTPLLQALQGVKLYYSNPKSPASVPTRLIAEAGDPTITDTLLGVPYSYGPEGFFQVNVPVYERVLERIKTLTAGVPKIVDMYSGVGTIGLSCEADFVTLVELDSANVLAAQANLQASGKQGEVVAASTEQALACITDVPVIFDPPRAGLHAKVVERVLETMPAKIIYLSCNPITQARDVARLQSAYSIQSAELFNFFPRTPHIESLLVLEPK